MHQMCARFLARVGKELGQTFRSLGNPLYRRYTIGQFTSLVGSQVNAVALSWTTYALTGSAGKLGIVTLATFLPVALLSIVGGAIADRVDRRKALVVTQSMSAAVAFTLAALAFTGSLSFPLILALGIVSGVIAAVDMPCRQAFVHDVVGKTDMVNAVGLNSLVWNSSRIAGPALAAALLSWGGTTVCFLLDGLSFVIAIVTITGVKLAQPQVKPDGDKMSLLAGLKVIAASPRLKSIILLVGVISCFAFQYSVMMPAYVANVLDGRPALVGILVAFAAAGSVIGNLVLASRGKLEVLRRVIRCVSILPGICLAGFVLAPTMAWAAASLFVLGGSLALLLGSANSYFQLTAPAEYRGRVMGIYMSVLVGTMPVGSLVLGQLADAVGVAHTLAVCAAACTIAALVYMARKDKEN